MKYQRVETFDEPRIRFEVLNELQLMLINKFPDNKSDIYNIMKNWINRYGVKIE